MASPLELLGGEVQFPDQCKQTKHVVKCQTRKHQQQNSAPKLNPWTSYQYSPTKNIYKQHQNQPTFFLWFSVPFILTWISKTQQKTVADLDPDTTEKLMTHKAPVSSVTFLVQVGVWRSCREGESYFFHGFRRGRWWSFVIFLMGDSLSTPKKKSQNILFFLKCWLMK